MSRMQSNMIVPFTPAVKWLLFITVGVWFLFQIILENFLKVPFTQIFALYPAKVLFDWNIWQVFSYIFLHSNSVFHILFNMLMLWFFGAELEQRWGSKFFVIYYIFSGVGAAILYVAGMAIYAMVTGSQIGLVIPVVGASGAVFGLMLAHAILFGDRIIYFFMVFPMKTKFFVLIMGFIQVASMMTSSVAGGEVAYLAHLGGIVSGYILLKSRGFIMQLDQKKKFSKKGRNLRLVVDNEKKDDSKGPKYWN